MLRKRVFCENVNSLELIENYPWYRRLKPIATLNPQLTAQLYQDF